MYLTITSCAVAIIVLIGEEPTLNSLRENASLGCSAFELPEPHVIGAVIRSSPKKSPLPLFFKEGSLQVFQLASGASARLLEDLPREFAAGLAPVFDDVLAIEADFLELFGRHD